MGRNLHFGWAIVTSKGIFYRHLFYSCPTAMKEQWYSKATASGAWPILILSDNLKCDVLHIFINGCIENAYVIEHPKLDTGALDIYFNQVNKLKQLRRKTRRLTSRKNRSYKFSRKR